MFDTQMMYVKLVLGLGVFVLVFTAGYRMGANNVQDDFDEYVHNQEEAEQEALLKRLAFNELVAKRHKEEVQQIKEDHANEIAKIRGDFERLNSKRLRVPKTACAGLTTSTTTTSTSGSNEGVTESWELSAETSEAFRQYALDADEIVASCRALQNFIKVNGLAP